MKKNTTAKTQDKDFGPIDRPGVVHIPPPKGGDIWPTGPRVRAFERSKKAGQRVVQTGFLGVRPENEKFRATVWDRKLRRNIYVGLFKFATTAAEAHDIISRQRMGDDAPTNFEGSAVSGRRCFSLKRISFFGVRYIRRAGKFQAYVRVCGKEISLGRFKCAEHAAGAYDAKARELYGADAVLNFPEEVQP